MGESWLAAMRRAQYSYQEHEAYGATLQRTEAAVRGWAEYGEQLRMAAEEESYAAAVMRSEMMSGGVRIHEAQVYQQMQQEAIVEGLRQRWQEECEQVAREALKALTARDDEMTRYKEEFRQAEVVADSWSMKVGEAGAKIERVEAAAERFVGEMREQSASAERKRDEAEIGRAHV